MEEDDFAADQTTTGAVIFGEQISGSLGTLTDSDWFAINLVENTTYNFNPTSFGPNVVLSIYDESGVKLGDVFPEIDVFDAIETLSFVSGFTGGAFIGLSRPLAQDPILAEDYAFTITTSTPLQLRLVKRFNLTV